jgi:hypothetical protein
VLFGVLLTASIASTVADLFRPANATGTLRSLATAARENVDRLSASHPNSNCWRNRSIHGSCF